MRTYNNGRYDVDETDRSQYNYYEYLITNEITNMKINYNPSVLLNNNNNKYLLEFTYTQKNQSSLNPQPIYSKYIPLSSKSISDRIIYLPNASNITSKISLINQSYHYDYEDLYCNLKYNSSNNTWEYSPKTEFNPQYSKFMKINSKSISDEMNYYLNQFYVYNVANLSFNINISINYDLICKVINYGVNNDNTFHVNEILKVNKFDVIPDNNEITLNYKQGSIVNSIYITNESNESNNSIELQNNNNYPIFIKAGSIIGNDNINVDSYLILNDPNGNKINGYNMKHIENIPLDSKLKVYSTIGSDKILYIGIQPKISGNWIIVENETEYSITSSIPINTIIADGSILVLEENQNIYADVLTDLFNTDGIILSSVNTKIKIGSTINNVKYDDEFMCDNNTTYIKDEYLNNTYIQYNSTLTIGSKIGKDSIINGNKYYEAAEVYETIQIKPYIETYGIVKKDSKIKAGSIINNVLYTDDEKTLDEDKELFPNDNIITGSTLAIGSFIKINNEFKFIDEETVISNDIGINNDKAIINSVLCSSNNDSIANVNSIVNDIQYTSKTILNNHNIIYPSYILKNSIINFTTTKEILLTGRLKLKQELQIGNNKLIVPNSYFKLGETIMLINNEIVNDDYKYSIIVPPSTQTNQEEREIEYPYYSCKVPIKFEMLIDNNNNEYIQLKTFINNRYITFKNDLNEILDSDIIDNVIDEEHSQLLLNIPIKMALDSKINEYRYNIMFKNIYPTIEYSNNLDYMKIYKTGNFNLYYNENINQVQLSKIDGKKPIEAEGVERYLIGYSEDLADYGYPDSDFKYYIRNNNQIFVYNAQPSKENSLYSYLVTYYSQNDLRFKIQKNIDIDNVFNPFSEKPYTQILETLGEQGTMKVMGTFQTYYTNTRIEKEDSFYEVNKNIKNMNLKYKVVPSEFKTSNNNIFIKEYNNTEINYYSITNSKIENCLISVNLEVDNSKIKINIDSIENIANNYNYILVYKINNNDIPLSYSVAITKKDNGYPHVEITDISSQFTSYDIELVKYDNSNYFQTIIARNSNRTYIPLNNNNNEIIWKECPDLNNISTDLNVLGYTQLSDFGHILVVKSMNFTDVLNSIVENMPIAEIFTTTDLINYNSSNNTNTTNWRCNSNTYLNSIQTDEYVFTMKGCTFPHIITLQNVDYVIKCYSEKDNNLSKIYILDKLDEYDENNPNLNISMTKTTPTNEYHDIYETVALPNGNKSFTNNNGNYLINNTPIHIQVGVTNEITITSNESITYEFPYSSDETDTFIYTLTSISYNCVLDNDKNTLTIIIHANQSLTHLNNPTNLLAVPKYIYKNTVLLQTSSKTYTVGADKYSQLTDNYNFQFNTGEFEISDSKYQFSVLSGISKFILEQNIVNGLYSFTINKIYSQCKFDSIKKLTHNNYNYYESDNKPKEYEYENIGIIKSYSSINPSRFYIASNSNNNNNNNKELYALTYPSENSENSKNSTTLLASNVREISDLNIPIQYGFKNVQMGLQTSNIDDTGNDSVILKGSTLTKYDIINNMTMDELKRSLYSNYISINNDKYIVNEDIYVDSYTKLCHNTDTLYIIDENNEIKPNQNNNPELMIYMCEDASLADRTIIRDKRVLYLRTYSDITRFIVNNDIVLNTNGGYCIFDDYLLNSNSNSGIESNDYLNPNTNYNSFELNNIKYNQIIESDVLFENQYSSKNNVMNNGKSTNDVYVYNGRVLVNSTDTIIQFIQNYTNSISNINILSDAINSKNNVTGVFKIDETKLSKMNDKISIPQCLIQDNNRMLVTIKIGVDQIPKTEGGNGYRIVYDCADNNLLNTSSDFVKIFKDVKNSFNYTNMNDPFKKKYGVNNVGSMDLGDKTTTIYPWQIENSKMEWGKYNPIILKWKNTNESSYEGGWDSGILSNSNENNYRIGVQGDDCIVRFAHMVANNGVGNYRNTFVIDMNMTENTLRLICGNNNNIIELESDYEGELKYAHFYYEHESNENNYCLSYPKNWTIDEIMQGIYDNASKFTFNNNNNNVEGFLNSFGYAIFNHFDKDFVEYTTYSGRESLGNYVYIFPCNQTSYRCAIDNGSYTNQLQMFEIYTKRDNYPTITEWKYTSENYILKYTSNSNGYPNIVGNKQPASNYVLSNIPSKLWNTNFITEIRVQGLARMKNCKFDKVIVSPIAYNIYTIDKLSVNNDLKKGKTKDEYSQLNTNVYYSIGIIESNLNPNISDIKVVLPYDTDRWYDYGNFDNKTINYNSDVFNAWTTNFNSILSTAEIIKNGDSYEIDSHITDPTAKINRIKIAKEYGNKLLATEILIYPGSLINSKIQTTTIKLKLNNLLSNTITYRTVDKGNNMIYINGNHNISYKNNEYGIICINSNAEEDETTEHLNVEHFNVNDLATIAFDQFETNVKSGSKIGPGQYNVKEYYEIPEGKTIKYSVNEIHYPVGSICNFKHVGSVIKYVSNNSGAFIEDNLNNIINNLIEVKTVDNNNYNMWMAIIIENNEYYLRKCNVINNDYVINKNYGKITNNDYINGHEYDYWSKFMISTNNQGKVDNPFQLQYLTTIQDEDEDEGLLKNLITSPIIPKSSIIIKGSIINDTLINEDRYIDEPIIINNYTVILHGSKLSGTTYYAGVANKYKGYDNNDSIYNNKEIPFDVIIPAYLTAYSGVDVVENSSNENSDNKDYSGSTMIYPELQTGSKILMSNLINSQEYITTNFDIPNLTTNNILFNYHFVNTRANAYSIEDGNKHLISIQEAVEKEIYPNYNIDIQFELSLSVNDLKLIGKKIENTNQYFITLYPKCKVYYPGLCHIEDLNCANKLEPINIIVELADINEAIIYNDYPNSNIEDKDYTFSKSNRILQFYTSDYTQLNTVLSDFMSCCGFAYSITPKYNNINKCSLKTELKSDPFKTVIHEITDENASKYKYNLISSKVYQYVSGPDNNHNIQAKESDNSEIIDIPMLEVEYYNNTNILRRLGTYTSTLSTSKITDDTAQICFKFYANNDGLEFLRIKMDLCDFTCCNSMFGIVQSSASLKYYLHVQSLKKYIDYYLNGQIIHDKNNHTEIYAYYSDNTNNSNSNSNSNKKFYLHNSEKYYYISIENYFDENQYSDINTILNEHNYTFTEANVGNNTGYDIKTIGGTNIDTSKLTDDDINKARLDYQPKKISSYEMICELFDKFSDGYFKIDILHQYYDNKATNGLYYDSVISYATTPTYFQYINYELNSQNIRQYVSYPNSNPVDERLAFARIDNTNYDATIETKFNYKDCENCINGCCDFGINPINTNNIDNSKYYTGALNKNIGSLRIYRGNLKITAIYITTMLPLYKENNDYTNVNLNYGVINFIDAESGEILQTTSYTCENSDSKNIKIKLTCSSGDITETYNSTGQITYVIENNTQKLLIRSGSIIGKNSIVNDETYIDQIIVDSDIEIKTKTKLSDDTILKTNDGYVKIGDDPILKATYNISGKYPEAQVKLFNNEDVEDKQIPFNYIPGKCYITFAIPILVDGHKFDYTNHFIVYIDKILCTYNLLSFNISQLPDIYRKTNVYISNESYMNYEETNMNNTYLSPGSTINKGSKIKNNDKFIDINENIVIESKLCQPLRIIKGSIINGERITSNDINENYLDYQYLVNTNSYISPSSIFIIDARQNTQNPFNPDETINKTNIQDLNKIGIELTDSEDKPYDENELKDFYLCKFTGSSQYRANIPIYLASQTDSGINSGTLGTSDYIFTENSKLVSSVLGFTVYQRAFLYNSLSGKIENEIELNPKLINRILQGSIVGKETQLNYIKYSNDTNEIENSISVSDKVSIPPESVLSPGTILKPGSMLNGKLIDEDYVIEEATNIVKVSEDSNYYLDTIYVDTDKYNTIEDLVKALNDNFKGDIYNNLNKYDEDVIFKNIIYINYETPKLLSLYDSEDNLYNIVIDWDSWDFKNMTASLTSGKKIYIYSIKNDGKNTVTRVVTVVSLDSDSEDSNSNQLNSTPKEIKFNFSDTTRSSWNLLQYEQTYDFIYSYQYDTAIPIKFKDMYDDEIINDELIDDTIVKDGDFITVSKIGDKYTYKFATEIIPVEFTEDDIPNEMNYLNLVRKFQNYEKYIDENADKMLVYPVIEKITGSYVNNENLTKYIKDYISAEKYFINFKQNQRSLWHKLGISPILINKENRPIIKVDEDLNDNNEGISSISGNENLNYVLENDLYDSFSEIVYYHYLGSYFTETIYNSDWMKLSHRFIHNRNNMPLGNVDIYDKDEVVEDGIKKFNLWNSEWRNDRKPDLDVPLTFMLKLSQYEDVEKVLNLASNNNNVIYTIDEQNITKDDNGDLVLSIYKTIDLKTSDPFYIYLDAKTHYPFERGVNALMSIEYNTTK